MASWPACTSHKDPCAAADPRDMGTHAAQGVVGQKRKAEDVPWGSKVQALDSAPEVPGTDAQPADSGAVKAGAAEAQAAFETDGGERLSSDRAKEPPERSMCESRDMRLGSRRPPC